MAKQKRYATHITTPTGARVYVSASTKGDLANKILEKKLEMRAGVDIATDMNFRTYAELWLKTHKAGRIRPTSFAAIRYTFDQYILPFFGDMTLRAIRPMHVQLFLGSVSHYSQSTQEKCFRNFRSVMASAADDGLIVKSPVRDDDHITANPPEETEPLTDEQARALLTSLEGTRAYTFCLLALSTGMRRGEILGLMWEDVDWAHNLIHVRHNKAFPLRANEAPVTEFPKTEAGRRDLPMGRLLAEHLTAEKTKSTSDYVVSMTDGRSLTMSSFRALWKCVELRVGRLGFTCHPHQLRHTYITQLFEAGLDLKQGQHLAGHSTPEMTMRVYTHYRAKQRAEETQQQVIGALNYLN